MCSKNIKEIYPYNELAISCEKKKKNYDLKRLESDSILEKPFIFSDYTADLAFLAMTLVKAVCLLWSRIHYFSDVIIKKSLWNKTVAIYHHLSILIAIPLAEYIKIISYYL